MQKLHAAGAAGRSTWPTRAEHLRQEAQQKLRALDAEIAAIDRAEGEAWKTWLERSAFCRSKTSRPSRSRMRNATVLGGNVRLAAAMTASDTSRPLHLDLAQNHVHVRAQRQRIGSETAAASLKGCVAIHPVVPRRQPPRPVARADHSLGTAARRKKPPLPIRPANGRYRHEAVVAR